MKKILMSVMALIIFASVGYGRDLAGITWDEFKNKSELVFSGILVEAKIQSGRREGGRHQQIQYTYTVGHVYKGPQLKSVTFKAPALEDINKTIGAISFISLKREGEGWVLSVDERSCWKTHNEMKSDFGGLPVVDIPTNLISDFPKELISKAALKKLCSADGKYHEADENVFQ